MIFTQADRERAERIEKALTSLHCDVGLRTADTRNLSLHQRWRDLEPLLNELGAALGRIESAIKPLSKLGLKTGARQTDRKVLDEILSGYNSDRILEFEDTKKALRIVVDTVNRRADESLDVVRGLRADFDQWPQWRNNTESILVAIKTACDGIDTVGDANRMEAAERHEALLTREQMTHNAIIALSARFGELTGLMQAEVSEASRFRTESKALIAALDRRLTQVLTDREQFPSMEQMKESNRKMLSEMLNHDTKPKRKARRKKK